MPGYLDAVLRKELLLIHAIKHHILRHWQKQLNQLALGSKSTFKHGSSDEVTGAASVHLGLGWDVLEPLSWTPRPCIEDENNLPGEVGPD